MPPAARPRHAPLLTGGLVLLCLGFETSDRQTPRAGRLNDLLSGDASRDARVPSNRQERRQTLEALQEARTSLKLIERTGVGDDLEVARILASMVQMLWSLEEYAEAKPLAERALAIRLKTLPPVHRDVASSLYQLAELSRATGDYAAAMRLHRRALAVWEKALGRDHSEAASSLHYLGVLALTTGDLKGAERLLEQALSIRQKTLGPSHEQVATTLNALAEVRARSGDRAEAAVLLERAQAIWERALGPDHPFIARSLTGRAHLLADTGDIPGARRLLERALEIRLRAFGPEHYLVGRSLADIAGLTARGGDEAPAEALYLRALEIDRRALGPTHPEVASTLAALARLQRSMGRVGPALEGALRAEEMAREYFLRSARDLTEDEALRYETLRTSGQDVLLSFLAHSPAGTTDRAAPEAPTDTVRRIADEIVRSRAVLLGDRTRGRDRPDGEPDLGEVTSALPDRSALIIYVQFQRLRRGAEPLAEYLALVVRPDSATPAAIPLGAAGEIDTLVADWRTEASSDPRLRPPGSGERAYALAGGRLREAIWDPLQPELERVRRVFVVPDGAISLVSLATLPLPGDAFLAESGLLIHYLSAPRDLVVERHRGAIGDRVLIVGAPDFDARSRTHVPAGPRDASTDSRREGEPVCPEFAALHFDPLPGAQAEAGEIESLLERRGRVLRLSGARADEATFKRNAPASSILHLATHAYVLPDRCGATVDSSEPLEDAPVAGDSPFLLSGVALAGANHRSDAGETPSAEDGILTAGEIASLDLSGVDWTVLSACDTGVGRILPGEGLAGLRRAFEVAGVRTVIMSLWAVDDGAARIWMRDLYEKRLSGLSTIEAVGATDLEVLRAQRARGRTAHPYFWGGFVAAGDWR